jgi:hypothetical protein
MDEIEARGLMLQAESEKSWDCLKQHPKLLFLYQLKHIDKATEIAEFVKHKNGVQEKLITEIFTGSENPNGPLPF